MILIYFILLFHLGYNKVHQKKRINIFTMLNVSLFLGFFDFFVTNIIEYENTLVLLITFIFTYIINFYFDESFKYKPIKEVYLKTRMFYIIYGLVIVFRLYSIYLGELYGTSSATHLELNSFSNILGFINNLGIYFFSIVVILNERKSMFLIGIIEGAWLLIGGSKIFFVVVLMIYFYNKFQKEPIKAKVFFYLGILVFVIPYLFNIAQAFRIQSKIDDKLDFSKVKEIILLENQFSSTQIKSNKIVERISTANYYDKLVSYSDRHPNNEFSSGHHFLNILFFYIPRSIWKDKPSVSYGKWAGEKIYGWNYESRSEAAVTLWGDFYNSFGLLGIFIGVFLFTFFIYKIFSFRLGGNFFILMFSLVVLNRVSFAYEQNFNSTFVFVIWSLFTCFFVYKIVLKKCSA